MALAISNAQPPALVERVSRHPDHKGDTNVPNSRRGGDVAGTKRELCARQEQDYASNVLKFEADKINGQFTVMKIEKKK
jgi:hypothetical protein